MRGILVLCTLLIAFLVGYNSTDVPLKSSPASTSSAIATSSTPEPSLLARSAAMSAHTTSAAVAKLYPALYLCHGGGPMPLLGDVDHAPMVAMWKEHVADIVSRYGVPKAIAVVSAHYQTTTPEIGGCPHPAMYYDYSGFPREAYSLQYPAPGNPELAARMVAQMQGSGLHASLNPKRKFDHGVFVPLVVTFETASIPVIPVSVLRSDDPAEHIKIGQALRSFREQGVFFIGSGSTMHNFDLFNVPNAGKRFGDAITAVLQDKSLSKEERLEKMKTIKSFDGFSDAQSPLDHEHLMPLLTLCGTADGAPGREVASVSFFAANVRHYIFEE
ncbi:putative protocatechuate 4 5-dioxygenase-like protein [Leptomonas seymouri]|uniref:Putative protocatechuate 4 5-dioxygenase-like protein n=1 Tax=Leptomonas seymouri TaxID=5684 RepID=A0A0N1HTM7_LEPSE|nr:putative protocatechuate 4 5-dioxygenase-like protein [Leptomonas seymouri]|eukprot:KPI83274.1 putative protocatechuate 4 5-dioxygenase-like protein [Leptomonas seymouri]